MKYSFLFLLHQMPDSPELTFFVAQKMLHLDQPMDLQMKHKQADPFLSQTNYVTPFHFHQIIFEQRMEDPVNLCIFQETVKQIAG